MGRLMKSAKDGFGSRLKKNEIAAPPAELALRALAFLSQDDERVSSFLALTGLDPGDETLLLEFAVAESLPPEAIGRARRALGGGEE